MSSKKSTLKAKVTSVAEGATRAAIEASIPGLNRQQRRALAGKGGDTVAQNLIEPPPNNRVWDDLNQMSARCGQLLATPGAFLPMLRNEALMKKVENMQLLDRTANVLVRDLAGFTKFYEGIRAQHSNMQGASTTPDEHLRAIMLYNDYNVWMEQFEANVRPMILQIAEIIAAAENLLAQDNPTEVDNLSKQVTSHIATHLHMNVVAEEPAMTPEQDPSVITDVQVKEVIH